MFSSWIFWRLCLIALLHWNDLNLVLLGLFSVSCSLLSLSFPPYHIFHSTMPLVVFSLFLSLFLVLGIVFLQLGVCFLLNSYMPLLLVYGIVFWWLLCFFSRTVSCFLSLCSTSVVVRWSFPFIAIFEIIFLAPNHFWSQPMLCLQVLTKLLICSHYMLCSMFFLFHSNTRG